MDVFDLADNLRAEFQEKGLSNEEFLLKIAETYDIKRVFVSSVADELFDKIPDKRIAEVPEVGMDEAKHLWFAFGIGKTLLRDRGLEPSNFDCMQFSNLSLIHIYQMSNRNLFPWYEFLNDTCFFFHELNSPAHNLACISEGR